MLGLESAWPQPVSGSCLPLPPDQITLILRAFHVLSVIPEGWGGLSVLNFGRPSPHSGSPLRSLQVPVEMAVLWSRLFSSQNGIVDATESGNIPAVQQV
jgi:hypothetical protein